MLTKKTPETIKADLTIKAQGGEYTLKLTYHNHAPDEFDAHTKNPTTSVVPDGVDIQTDPRLYIANLQATAVLFLVKSFDDGTADSFPLTREGLLELERYWPESLACIVQGFHQARGASVAKN